MNVGAFAVVIVFDKVDRVIVQPDGLFILGRMSREKDERIAVIFSDDDWWLVLCTYRLLGI